jgi:hypothetical protein
MKHFKLMKGVLACLLSLALVLSCFTTVGIKAAETAADSSATVVAPTAVAAQYNWQENTITASSNAYVYVLKAEKGNAIKAGTAANGQLASGKISLTDLKIKAVNKDVFFYVCDKEFETEGKSIDANLVIKATSVKKAAGKIDYTQADNDSSFAVLSATGTDTAGKKLENPVVYWSTEANGTYYLASSDTTSTGNTRKYADGKTVAKDGFDGRTLREMLESGGTIYIKIAPAAASGTYQFPSKVIKVKITKQAKAPKVAIDVKKDTYSIKNGMDYALFEKSTSGEYTLVADTGWHTLLPQLKEAATKTLEESIVDTSKYNPLDKKDENAKKAITDNKVAYTSLKVKTIDYTTLVTSLSAPATDTEYYVGVRTSATAKKPASAVTYFKYAEKTEAPIVYTESCVDGQYLVSTGTDFAKKGLRLGSIVNYNGTNGTEGYDDSFKIKATAGSGADTAKAAYEYAIVNKSDLQIIDWSTVGWKKLDAKTKITGKLKTKYNTVSGTTVKKTSATLTAANKPANFTASATSIDNTDDIKTLILVRRAGVKAKTADDTIVASDLIKLYVLKDGKNYEIYSEKSVGEEAVKYTVEFYKWSLSGESTYTWVKDDSLTITGWGREDSNSGEEIVAFPEAAKADFFKFTTDATSGEKVEAISAETNKGKYVVDITGTSGEQTIKYAIREYANITVSGIGVTGNSGDEVTGSDVTIAKVIDGKVATSTSGAWTVSGSGEVTVYVGDTTELTVADYTVPEGYVLKNGGTRTVKAGEGYAIANTSGWTGSAGDKLSVTINTSDAVTVKVATPIVKTYTVTLSTTLNGISLKNEAGDALATAFPNGTVKFKVAGTASADHHLVVKVGDKKLTADENGVYNTTISNANITITVIEEAD